MEKSMNSQFAICEIENKSLSLSMKAHNGMRPQDIAVLLKILGMPDNWQNKHLAETLFISNSEISESLNRSIRGKLLSPDKRMVFEKALYEFIVYGLKHVFPTEPGRLIKGIPTAHSAPVLADYFVFDNAYVWPDPKGTKTGFAVEPLYPNQPLAALADKELYAKLALVDAIRVGRVREREKAAELLKISFERENASEYHQTQSR